MTDDKSDTSKSLTQRELDARKAMADYQAEQAAVLAKSERLRALRLEREAAMGPKVTAAKRSVAGKKAQPKKQTETAKPLSEWLKSQRDDGWRS